MKALSHYYSNQRRLRSSRHIRELVSTVTLSHRDFIQPLFIDASVQEQTPIGSLSGIHSDTIESVLRQIELDLNSGTSKFLLFPVPAGKSERDFDFTFAVDVVRKIKSTFGSNV